MHKLQLRSAAVVLAAATLLAACGGSDDDGPPGARTSEVPQSAQGSVAGLIDYINQLIGMTSETSEPVFVGDAVLPVDDTAAPSPVN